VGFLVHYKDTVFQFSILVGPGNPGGNDQSLPGNSIVDHGFEGMELGLVLALEDSISLNVQGEAGKRVVGRFGSHLDIEATPRNLVGEFTLKVVREHLEVGSNEKTLVLVSPDGGGVVGGKDGAGAGEGGKEPVGHQSPRQWEQQAQERDYGQGLSYLASESDPSSIFREDPSETRDFALLDALPANTASSLQLRAVSSVHNVGGIMDRYLYPLLVGRGKGHTDPTTCLIEGLVYPRWYPVPSDWEDGSGGGTKQCRIVAKGPACQTFPPIIKKCIISRYSHLIWFDYSQIELRVAALLSNDPWMMGEYSKSDCDFHLGTARKLFGEKDAKKYRQVGKILNFLLIYLGEAKRFQSTLFKEEGIVMSLSQCQTHIDNWWKAAPGLRKWQEETYESVCEKGYFELPLAGQSRLFLGNRSEVRNQIKEIVNMPVQAIAANIMLSAQFELQWAFKKKRMKAILPLNVYDAATIEFPRTEMYSVKKEMERILPNPPYYQALCATLGRTLPLKYDLTLTEVPTRIRRKVC